MTAIKRETKLMQPSSGFVPIKRGPKFKDITGRRFGRLVVLRDAGDYKPGNPQWECRCDCGNLHIVSGRNIASGNTTSCGCRRIESLLVRNKTYPFKVRVKHGFCKNGTRLPEYNAWKGIHARCKGTDEKNKKWYYDRGISVCERWSVFQNFIEDMGMRPSERHSVGRIDNDKGYSPENCRWETPTEQACNKQNNCVISFNGESMPLAEWSRKTGISYCALISRIRLGWSPERALTEPVGTYHKSLRKS